MSRSLTIIIPVYNEEDSIPELIPSLIETSKLESWDIIIVDDCSTDSSGTLLHKYQQQYGFILIRNKRNKGYGGAIKEGIRAVKTELLVTIDADGQHKLEDIKTLLKFYCENDADMVVGMRKNASSTLYRRFGKFIIRLIARILISIPIKDINSGMKLYNTDLAKQYIKLCPDTMAYSDSITFCYHIQKHLVLEYPISVNKRNGGRSTISAKTAFQTIIELFNIVMLFNPLNIFLPMALICICFGIVWGLPILLKGNGVSTGSMLAIVSGILSVFLGLIAEQLSKFRRTTI